MLAVSADHRLGRRQARPAAEPVQPARRAARPGRRPAVHPGRADRLRHPRLHSLVGGRADHRPGRAAGGYVAGAPALRLHRAAGALPGQGRDILPALRVADAAAGPVRRDWSAQVALPISYAFIAWGMVMYLWAGAIYLRQVGWIVRNCPLAPVPRRRQRHRWPIRPGAGAGAAERYAGTRCRRCWSRWAATTSIPDTPRRPRRNGRRRPRPASHRPTMRPGAWSVASWSRLPGGRRCAVRACRQRTESRTSRERRRPDPRCWRTSTGRRSAGSELASVGVRCWPSSCGRPSPQLGAAGPAADGRASWRAAGQITPVTGPGLRVVIDEAPAGGTGAVDRRRHPRPRHAAAGQRPVGGRGRSGRDRWSPAATRQRDPAGRRLDPGGQPPGVLAARRSTPSATRRPCRSS